MTYYRLPEHAIPFLGRQNVGNWLWRNAERLEGCNRYDGIVENSCQFFRQIGAVMFESKAAIDADGSGGNAHGDRYYQADTSLHTPEDEPLNAETWPFAVIPLPSRALGEFNIQDVGLALGDFGVCIYNGRVCPFIFGDAGPREKIGEISMHLARQLRIPDSPVDGGIDKKTVMETGGVITLAFPYSAKKQGRRTLVYPQGIEVYGMTLWREFLAQARMLDQCVS